MPPEKLLAARASAAKITRKFSRLSARIAPYAAAASAALILWHAARDTPAPLAGDPAPLIYPGSQSAPPPASAVSPQRVVPAGGAASAGPGSRATAASTIEVVVGRNDTLDAIFRRMALDPADLAAIRHLPGIRQSLDFLKPGDSIRLTRNDRAVEELTRKMSDTETLRVTRDDAGFAARVEQNPVQTRIRTATATIQSSLFQAAEAARISEPVALKLASVFAWDIDFVLDLREGDRFTAVYEQIYRDGRYLRDGDLLAAEFVNNGKIYRAVRYVGESGAVGYYTPDGKPMRKAFLRAPVEFTRVSSGFNPHRLHPILNLIRGHMGTDYAAPIGTPVHAAADGRVSFEGVRGGYGNAIMLAHSNGISTLYGHMSHFARGLRAGMRVQQGQVIGYVGMTGLATGPHLHYEYLVNGVHKDPQTVKLPGAEPLTAGAFDRFHAAAAAYLADLAAPASVPAAATATAPATAAATAPAAAGSPAAVEGAARAMRQSPAASLPPGFSLAGMSQFPGESRGAVD